MLEIEKLFERHLAMADAGGPRCRDVCVGRRRECRLVMRTRSHSRCNALSRRPELVLWALGGTAALASSYVDQNSAVFGDAVSLIPG